jgi:hypothetical protein
MRFYHYILLIFLFLFISVICRIYYLFFRKPSKPRPVKKRITEGFGTFDSLDNCLGQGYPDDFCMRAPLESCITNCPVGSFKPKTFNSFA